MRELKPDCLPACAPFCVALPDPVAMNTLNESGTPMYTRIAHCLAVVLAVLAPAAVTAQDASKPVLSVHGYLTQAFGISDRYPTMGLTEDGTADYRRAAIMARYEATTSDHFVVQMAHRRLGDSPTMQFEDNIKLDMAFYERRFASTMRLRVGKTPLPFGIYNEVRYVGTLLPFYRAPYAVYSEGIYTAESIDGVSLSQRFRGGKPWETSIDAYTGSFKLLEFGTWSNDFATEPLSYMGAVVDAKNVLGGQLWVATPVEGLRMGIGGRREKDFGGVYPRPNGTNTEVWIASVDGTFDRVLVRAERLRVSSEGVEMNSQYAQLGLRVLPWLSVNGQIEANRAAFQLAPESWHRYRLNRDEAVGLNFFLNDGAVFKLEAHSIKGYLFEQTTDITQPPRTGAYFISSFSIGF